jgi:hypothetical protein
MILHKHDIIGIDVDDTLLGRNPTKYILWDFIAEHHKTKTFHLITFRIE